MKIAASVVAAVIFSSFSAPAVAQLSAEAEAPLMADLMTDVGQAEGKLLALAGAIPEDQWDWRPAEGVRSIREVFMHVAADNYFIPAALGIAPPASTGISGDSYPSVQDYEARVMDAGATTAELASSFEHLRAAMSGQDAATLNDPQSLFGQEFTGQQLWILTATHLHEHLGQMIAYARMNGIVPPWSQ
ncbi:MAG TPA: DinB family protein [Longimicrobiaceae bacterium]|nr:DinB family protein [Longimicrobiaceae bacterium]